MRKRERENPCGVCGHYHKYEEGEVCGVCGHRIPVPTEKTSIHVSAFPSEILPEFLYLGSYDNASRSELLKTQGISRVLNVRYFIIQSLFWYLFCHHWGSIGFLQIFTNFATVKKSKVFIKRSYVGFFIALWNLSCHCRDFGSRFFGRYYVEGKAVSSIDSWNSILDCEGSWLTIRSFSYPYCFSCYW